MADNAVNAQKFITHKIGNLIRNVCVQDVQKINSRNLKTGTVIVPAV